MGGPLKNHSTCAHKQHHNLFYIEAYMNKELKEILEQIAELSAGEFAEHPLCAHHLTAINLLAKKALYGVRN